MNRYATSCVAVMALFLSACATNPTVDAIPAPAPTAPVDVSSQAQAPASTDPCDLWEPASRDWFELTATQEAEGETAIVASYLLPPSGAPRYNTVLELCPGVWWAVTYAGESRFIDVDADVWSVGPSLASSGTVDTVSAAGVQSGGPTWGFRDSTLAVHAVYLSDGVLDTAEECVRVDVHTLALGDLLASRADEPLSTEVAYQSSPCVSYTAAWRSGSPLRTHLGSALTFAPKLGSVFLTIGDFHLGASSLGQAATIGIANTEKDYALLSAESAALGALVKIPTNGDRPEIVAKGLRNSLGITTDGNGSLWISDHGPAGGDELNRYAPGANYGWPYTTEGEPYDRSSWPTNPDELPAPWLDIGDAVIAGATYPTLSWTPAIAPTAVVDISRDASSLVELAIGGLRAEVILTLSIDGTLARETGRLDVGARVRDMARSADAARLLAITDSATLFVINPAKLR